VEVYWKALGDLFVATIYDFLAAPVTRPEHGIIKQCFRIYHLSFRNTQMIAALATCPAALPSPSGRFSFDVVVQCF
jgi:hypothetical protein